MGVSQATLNKAYVGFLGFYKSQRALKWSNAQLVDQANYFMQCLGEPAWHSSGCRACAQAACLIPA